MRVADNRPRELYPGRRHVVVLLRTVSLIRHRVDKCMAVGRAVYSIALKIGVISQTLTIRIFHCCNH